MPNIDPGFNALEAVRREFRARAHRQAPSRKQPFNPVCVCIPSRRNPYRYRLFCLGRSGRALPRLSEEFTLTITSTIVPEVVRKHGRWVKKHTSQAS